MNTPSLPPVIPAPENLEHIDYPVLASRKIVGPDLLVVDGVVKNAYLEPYTSRRVQFQFGLPEYNGLAGVGTTTKRGYLQFNVIDKLDRGDQSYEDAMIEVSLNEWPSNISVPVLTTIRSADQLRAYLKSQAQYGVAEVAIRDRHTGITFFLHTGA